MLTWDSLVSEKLRHALATHTELLPTSFTLVPDRVAMNMLLDKTKKITFGELSSNMLQALAKYTDNIEILRLLSTSSIFHVLEEVALNKHTTADILERLIKERPTLAKFIARNDNATPRILQSLANRKDAMVVLQVARNKNLDLDTIKKLAASDNPHIRQAIARRDDITPEIITIIMDTEAKMGRWYVDSVTRQIFSKSPIATPKILDRLANDINDIPTIVNVLNNKQVSIKTIQRIKESTTDHDVKSLATIRDPNATVSEILQLLRSLSNYGSDFRLRWYNEKLIFKYRRIKFGMGHEWVEDIRI